MTSAVNTLDDVGVCHQAASLLLAYPDQQLLDRLPLLREAVGATPWASHFDAVLAHLEGQSLVESQTFHVAEFDTSRRHALHLSYWTDGDTRRRGEVLAAIKQTYRDSGLLVDLDGELPDYLPMVLEFAANGAPALGVALLNTYRASLELLRLGLVKDKLPHAGVVAAICDTLGGPSPQTRAEVQELLGTRPSELVGLEPFINTTPFPAAGQELAGARQGG